MIIVVLLAIFILIVIMIKFTLESAKSKKNLISVYFKLLSNHIQLLLLTIVFNFNFPEKVVKIFEGLMLADQSLNQLLSLDWLIDKRSGSDTNDSNFIRLYYQRMIIYALLPWLFFLLSWLFWNVFCCCKKIKITNKWSKIKTTWFCLFFLFHPTIIEYMCSNFK